jgi:hypothetical protein
MESVMTKRIIATIVLVFVILFLSWYAYQEYKKAKTITALHVLLRPLEVYE